VHEDGWHIEGCPVNGPAVGASGRTVAVAWFTAARDEPRVHVGFSGDGGQSFGTPIRVDSGNPGGRVDLLMRGDRSVLVSWLERTGGDQAEIRIRSIDADGSAGVPVTVTRSSAERASGFPRMIEAPWDPSKILVAWTDVSEARDQGVRVTEVEVQR